MCDKLLREREQTSQLYRVQTSLVPGGVMAGKRLHFWVSMKLKAKQNASQNLLFGLTQH